MHTHTPLLKGSIKLSLADHLKIHQKMNKNKTNQKNTFLANQYFVIKFAVLSNKHTKTESSSEQKSGSESQFPSVEVGGSAGFPFKTQLPVCP